MTVWTAGSLLVRSMLAFLPALAAACGYSLIGSGGDATAELETLYVEVRPMDQGDPLLAETLGRELRRLVRRDGRMRIVGSPDSADGVLHIDLRASDMLPVAFDRYDDVLDYESTIRVDAVLSSRSGKTLWERQGISATRGHAAVPGAVVSSSSEFQSAERLAPGVLGQFDSVQLGEERKRQATQRIIGDLANAIYDLMKRR